MLFAVVVIVHTASWALFETTPQLAPDSITYINPVHNIIETGTFAGSSGNLETKRTPGYPLLIAASFFAGWDLAGVVVAQHAMCFVMMLLIGRILYKKGGEHDALLGAGLIGCNIILTVYSNVILSEIWFTFLIIIVFYLFASFPNDRPLKFLILAGVMGGFATLIRPIGLYLGIPLGIYLLIILPRNRLVHALVFLLSFFLIPCSWMARNYDFTGHYNLSSISDINLLGYTAAGALALKEGGNYAVVHERIKQNLLSLAEKEAKAKQLTTKERSNLYKSHAISIIADNPYYFIKHTVRSAAITLLGNAATYISQLFHLSQQAARGLAITYSIPALLLSLYGLSVCWRRQRQLAVISLLFISYFTAIAAVGGVGGSRFRIPVEPIFCMLMTFSIMDIAQRLKSSRLFSR